MWIVYKTTNLVNGKFYIGIHKGTSADSYLGSGKALSHAIKKYDRENFTRETLFEGLDEMTARSIESELVSSETIENPNCYNMVVGGGLPPNLSGRPKSEQQKLKMSVSAKKSWLDGKRTQHKQSDDFKQNIRLNNPSKRPEVKLVQSQKMRAYYDSMTPEQRSERARKIYETRRKNKELMTHV